MVLLNCVNDCGCPHFLLSRRDFRQHLGGCPPTLFLASPLTPPENPSRTLEWLVNRFFELLDQSAWMRPASRAFDRSCRGTGCIRTAHNSLHPLLSCITSD